MAGVMSSKKLIEQLRGACYALRHFGQMPESANVQLAYLLEQAAKALERREEVEPPSLHEQRVRDGQLDLLGDA